MLLLHLLLSYALDIDFPHVARATCVPILWGLCVGDRLWNSVLESLRVGPRSGHF